METVINNPAGAFAFGASYGNAPVQASMTSEYVDLVNGTTQTLYTGDIVALDSTGSEAILTTTGNLTNVIGCVGNPADLNSLPAQYYKAGTATSNAAPWSMNSIWGVTIGGDFQPPSDYAWTLQTVGFTNGSANMTDSSSAAVNPLIVGAYVITPYNASTNATPQIFQVVTNGGSAGSWTAVGTVVAGGGTTFSGTTGSFSCQVGMPANSLGPGWPNPQGWTNSSTFPPNAIVPVITRGLGRVNVDGVSAVALSDGLGGTNASVIGTRFAYAATGYANATGLIIAVALEAYANRDTTIRTALGITGHDSVRALIGKM